MKTVLVEGDSSCKPAGRELEDLFREHYQLVYRTAYSVTGRKEDAEDIVQSVFLKLLHREFPTNIGKNPKGYLYRAALNSSLDTIRRRQRHVFIFDNKFDSTVKAAEARDAEDLDRRLWEAIAELQPSSAQILILRYVHNYSLTEISKTLGTTTGAVAVSLFRSRSRLKKLIRENAGGNL